MEALINLFRVAHLRIHELPYILYTLSSLVHRRPHVSMNQEREHTEKARVLYIVVF